MLLTTSVKFQASYQIQYGRENVNPPLLSNLLPTFEDCSRWLKEQIDNCCLKPYESIITGVYCHVEGLCFELEQYYFGDSKPDYAVYLVQLPHYKKVVVIWYNDHFEQIDRLASLSFVGKKYLRIQ